MVGQLNLSNHCVLQCMFTPTLTLLQPTEEFKCPPGDFKTDQGICCNKCSQGTVHPPEHHTWFKLLEISHVQASSHTIKFIPQALNCVYMWCLCFPGFKLVEECHGVGQRSNCTPCPSEQYTDRLNFSPTCRSCKECRGRSTISFCLNHILPVRFANNVSSDSIMSFCPENYNKLEFRLS